MHLVMLRLGPMAVSFKGSCQIVACPNVLVELEDLVREGLFILALLVLITSQ